MIKTAMAEGIRKYVFIYIVFNQTRGPYRICICISIYRLSCGYALAAAIAGRERARVFGVYNIYVYVLYLYYEFYYFEIYII